MVMNDYGPTVAVKFSKDYKAILKLRGKLQLASRDHIEELAETGLLRIEFESLRAQAVKLLEDPEVHEDLNLPRTIVHGDIYDDKHYHEDMEYVQYDWGSARIDIPFMDVMNLESEVCDEDRSTLGMGPYLELWVEYGSVEHLKRVCSDLQTKENNSFSRHVEVVLSGQSGERRDLPAGVICCL